VECVSILHHGHSLIFFDFLRWALHLTRPLLANQSTDIKLPHSVIMKTTSPFVVLAVLASRVSGRVAAQPSSASCELYLCSNLRAILTSNSKCSRNTSSLLVGRTIYRTIEGRSVWNKVIHTNAQPTAAGGRAMRE
jgi:hypothetical protein